MNELEIRICTCSASTELRLAVFLTEDKLVSALETTLSKLSNVHSVP